MTSVCKLTWALLPHPTPPHPYAFCIAGFYPREWFYTLTLLHTDAFTHRRFYTQTHLHTDAFTHRHFYTEHTEAFKQTLLHRRFYTDAFTHRSFDTQHTEALYTQKKIAILPQFLAIDPHFVRKGCKREPGNRNSTSVFDDRTSFRAKGLRRTSWNRNFTSVFDDRTSFRAKGLRGTTWTRTFTSVFDAADTLKSQFYLSFWRSNLVSWRKGCAGHLEIAILPLFLAIEPHFVRKGCVSCRLVGTAPAPAFRREIEKKERARGARGQEEKMWRCEDVKMWWRCEDVRMRRCEEEGKRARGQEGKRRRCEDVRMWRCEDVRMRRCEDEQMWRCEDEQMWRWADVKMRRCEDEQMWRWADVKMRRCEDEKMWRWEDVKMRRCEDVKMRRWETNPHYWKNPALRRSREKNNSLIPKWYISMGSLAPTNRSRLSKGAPLPLGVAPGRAAR